MRNILDATTRSACHHSSGAGSMFWMAGQRFDPTSGESTFVWRVTSTDTYSDTVSVMGYTNWAQGEPNNWRNGLEACTLFTSATSYKWNDVPCSDKWCSVCEVDIYVPPDSI